MKHYSFLLLLLLIIPVTQASLLKDTLKNIPIQAFSVPVFGQNGYKAWDFWGKEGFYKDDTALSVKEMRLRIYDGEPTQIIRIKMTSPQATIDMHTKNVTSSSNLLAESPNYTVTGKGWTWSGPKQTVSIANNVKVTFNDVLKGILP